MLNELKTLISSIIPRILNIYQVKKWVGGASIRINMAYQEITLIRREV